MIFAPPNNFDYSVYATLLCILAVPVGAFLFFALPVARQARRRGYSGIVWLLAAIISLNPLLILIVLIVLPDRRKLLLREKERQDLEAKLAARAKKAPLSETVQSVPAVSLGDQATAASFVRSIGDEETNG